MSSDAWVTLLVLVVAFGAMVWDRAVPSAVMLTATMSLMLLDVISSEQALSGFSNPAPITVAALFVLARAAQKTGLLAGVTARLLGPGDRRSDLARLLVPVAGLSAFLNNTPLVSMLVPDVVTTSRRRGLSPSRLLMPLSFAAILGGTVTVLGTSTNLVMSGLLLESTGMPLGVFEVTWIGLPVAVVGLAVLLISSAKLLPTRTGASEQAEHEVREFVVVEEIVPDGPLDGRRVADTDLITREHVYLAQLERAGQQVSPVPLDTKLIGGDRLVFVGQVEQVVGLYRIPGLRSSARTHVEAVAAPGHLLHVAVVGRTSPLAGHTLAEVDFVHRYQAVVLAIHRDGHRLADEPRDVRLRSGDALSLLADASFPQRWRERRDFLLVSAIDADPPQSSKRARLVGAIGVAMVVIAAFGWLSILETSLVAAGMLVATRTMSAHEVRDAIDFDVVILIAASFGLGHAMSETGLALRIATGLVSVFEPLGTVGLVFGLLLAVSLLTELITNNAAVVVVFPIALSVAAAAGLDLRTIAVAVAVAGSSSFLTPIGYQTNTIVYGPGGYRFTDYLRLGGPVNLAVVATITGMVMLRPYG